MFPWFRPNGQDLIDFPEVLSGGYTASMLFSVRHLGAVEEVGSGLRWDSATLAREVARRVSELLRLGIGRGSLVAITHGGTANFLADLLATWIVGAAAACLDPALRPTEFSNVIEFAQPQAILVSGTASINTGAAPVLDLAEAPDSAELPARPALEPADLALVLFTSGTTGVPKGVALSFGALAVRITSNIAVIGKPQLRRTLVTLPTSFGHGLIGNALTPLLAGCTCVLAPTGLPLAKELDRLIDDHQITFMSSVPALWRLALRLGEGPHADSLLCVHVGSAPLAAELWSAIAAWSRCEVVNCYGMTETANWFSGASSREGVADGLVGKPWNGAVAVRDGSGVIEAMGEGEIIVQSPALMSGYLNRPDLTAAVLKNGWYHTGDRGRVDEEGRIWLTGRIKEEINRAGLKIQPAELDRLIETHPAVAEACAFAQPDPISGELVAVAVRLVADASVTATALQRWCRERLRPGAVPEHWYFVEEIPRTPRGKVSRDALTRYFAQNASPAV
jgi:acyl-CoA synthetase (AMP-forming)/AMP-acid ligase II